MTERFEVLFPLLGGSEKRFAYIYLPKSYFREPNRRYPVLYMFDGHNVFFDEDATYGQKSECTYYHLLSEDTILR